MTDSDACKRFLVAHHAAQGQVSRESEWKRIGKSRDAAGRWVRGFRHPRLGEVRVVETAAGLALEGGAAAGCESDPDGEGARRLLERFFVLSERAREEEPDKDPLDAVLESPEYARCGHALPRWMTYWFPAETYGNEDLTADRLDRPADGFCVFVEDAVSGDPDSGAVDLVKPFMPDWLDPIDEYHFEAVKGCGRTLREMMAHLDGLGFRRDETQCVLGRRSASGLAPGLPGADAGARPSDIGPFLRNDDWVGLNTFLEANPTLRSQTTRSQESWIRLAYEQKAVTCFGGLLLDAPPIGRFFFDDLVEDALRPGGPAWVDYVAPVLAHPVHGNPCRTEWGDARLESLLLQKVWSPRDRVDPPRQAAAAAWVAAAIESQPAEIQDDVWVRAACGCGKPSEALVAHLLSRELKTPAEAVERAVSTGQGNLAFRLAERFGLTPDQLQVGGFPWGNYVAGLERALMQVRRTRMVMVAVDGRGMGRVLPTQEEEALTVCQPLVAYFARQARQRVRP